MKAASLQAEEILAAELMWAQLHYGRLIKEKGGLYIRPAFLAGGFS
jgi:hypothetical protein